MTAWSGLDRRTRLQSATLAAVPMLITVWHLGRGAGFVLDDWFLRANARFDGFWSVAGEHSGQRPAAIPLWALALGVGDGSPVPGLLLLAAGSALFAVALLALLRQVLRAGSAFAAALLWVILPTHTSLEVWIACVNLVWSQALGAAGILLGARPERSRWHLAASGVLFAVATLAYEANVAVLALGILLFPWFRDGKPDRALVAVGAGSIGAALIWVFAHWFEGKEIARQLAPVDQVLQANLGWAFLPRGDGSSLLTIAFLALGALAIGRLASPSLRRTTGTPEVLVAVGAAIMLAGTIPFALYVYEPVGAGDRANGLSAVGGALFLVGAYLMAARRWRRLALSLAVLAAAGASLVRYERLTLWHLAGTDAQAVIDGVAATIPQPDGTIVVGPGPIAQEKIVAFVDASSLEPALELRYETRSIEAELIGNEEALADAPEDLRFDMRPVSRLDDR